MTTSRKWVSTFASTVVIAIIFCPSLTVHATTRPPSARALLSKLKVASEHTSGYERSLFTLWDDQDHDGCNTRKEVLLAEAIVKPRISGTCSLVGGRWLSAYDGSTFTNSRQLDIDHMVPLAEAWASGAYRWNASTRESYANDLGYSRSLIAVSATSNRSKSDSDPYLWMPPRYSYSCQYVNDWIAIKYRWNLNVDPQERRDLVSKLSRCPQRPMNLVPRKASITYGPSSPSQSDNGTHSTPSANSGGSNSLDPHFSSCTAAKASGYGPYRQGQDPEYDWYIDRDHDGIACE